MYFQPTRVGREAADPGGREYPYCAMDERALGQGLTRDTGAPVVAEVRGLQLMCKLAFRGGNRARSALF